MILISETIYGEVLKETSIQLGRSLHLENHCHVITYLKSQRVLNTGDLERLERQKNGKPGELIDILMSKPERMFQDFLDALKEDYDWIVEDLNSKIEEKKKLEGNKTDSPAVVKKRGPTDARSNADSGNVSMAKSQGEQSDFKKKNNRKRKGKNRQNKQNGSQLQGQGQNNSNDKRSNRTRNNTMRSVDTGYTDSTEMFKEHYTENWVNEHSPLGRGDGVIYEGPTPYGSHQGPQMGYGPVFVQDHTSIRDQVVVYDPASARQHARDYYGQQFPNQHHYGDPRYSPMHHGGHYPNGQAFQSGSYRGTVPNQGQNYRHPFHHRSPSPELYLDQQREPYDETDQHSQGMSNPPGLRRRAIAQKSEERETEAKSKRILKVISGDEKHDIKPAYKIKIILGGEPYGGKSSLLNCYYREGKEPRLHDKSTLGIDMPHQVYMMHGTHFSVTFFDVPGHINKRNIFNSYFKGCHGAIMVYDITNRDSIESLDQWLSAVEKNMTAEWLFPITIVGNKTDLKIHEDTQKLNQQELDKLEKKYSSMFDIMFTSTSAKDFENVIPAFEGIVIRIAENREIRNSAKNDNGSIVIPPHRTRNDQSTHTKHGCC